MELVKRAREAGTPIICSMGAGNKTDPTAFLAADIYETSVCPLAKVMRGLCRREGIESLRVVYSKEPPMTPVIPAPRVDGRTPPASAIFAPAAAGLAIAREVVMALGREKK
jgi:tRNA A37 threonylcarbamoyladenosine dehydratase